MEERAPLIRRYSAALRLALVLADGVTAVAVFVLLSLALFPGDWMLTWKLAGVDPLVAAVAFGIAWPAALWLAGLYRMRSRWTLRGEVVDFVRVGALLAVASFATLFAANLDNVSRSFLGLLFPTQLAVTLVSRFALRRLFAWMRGKGMNTRYMLIVGTSPSAMAFATRVERHPDLGLKVVGHLALETNGAFVGRRPVLGTVNEIEEILHSRIIDEVAICLPPASLHLVEPIVRLCEEEGRIVRLPLDDLGLTLTGGRIEEFDSIPVMSFVYGPDRTLGLLLKRILDIVLSAAAIVVLSPVLIAVALAVFIADGRPILFRQTRMGLHGRSFQVVKFRTMVRDAEARLIELESLNEINGHAFKVTFDPRLSRLGIWLRRTSLDELPQLWNVLRGEMSIVGPRPPLPREVVGYDVWHRRRLSMKPGMTGLWQVSARREADFDRWVAIDLEYIDRWSLWLDFKIIARTIPAVVMHQGR
jgi:exopolysaccharide biosynthesis polyprenyl glycosylphosphotransferase